MAISFPDALPPQQASLTVSQDSAQAVLTFRGFRIHLSGAAPVPQATLQRAIERAEDLSAALRVLSSEYQRAGYPAARLYYMLAGEDLFVAADLGRVTEVVAPEPLVDYFSSVPAHRPLQDTDLEPARILGSLHADRAGLALTSVLEPGIEGSVLRLQSDEPEVAAARLRAEINNYGNRFTGRHFFELDARRGLSSGDEFNAGWKTSLSALNEDRRADEYNDYRAGWSRVTPAGVFGVAVSAADYAFDVARLLPGASAPAEGRIVQAETAWLYPLIAGQGYRWLVDARLDYTYKKSNLRDGAVLQKEEYASAEGGLSFIWETDWFGAPATLETGAQIRRGLGDEDEADAANLGYLLLRPRLTTGVSLDDHWDLQLDTEVQLTDDTVPEQSQWVLGGPERLAAYLPGIAVGDSGGWGRLQLTYFSGGSLLGIEWIPRAFVEYGYARYETPMAEIRPAGTVELSDAGAQLDLRYRDWLRGSIGVARGLGESGISAARADEGKANFYFRLAATF